MQKTSPRAERSDGIRTRKAILEAAASLATIEGLDGLSIGRLAEHIGISKSGLYAHFGSKEELQLATIETALQIFDEFVTAPAREIDDPMARLDMLADRFLDHLRQNIFPGGCFFAAAAAELDTHPGPVRERIAQVLAAWGDEFLQQTKKAQSLSLLDPTEDPDQLVFELDSYLLMANMSWVMSGGVEGVLTRAKVAYDARLERSKVLKPSDIPDALAIG